MTVPSKAVQRACHLLRKRVRFEMAELHLPPDIGLSDTDRIRDACRLYTETWVVPLINAIERGDVHFMKSVQRGME